jgi:hypothetical protein
MAPIGCRYGDSERGRQLAEKRWAAERQKRVELERQAVEKLERRLLHALDTYLEVMDNQEAPLSQTTPRPRHLQHPQNQPHLSGG